AALELAEQAQGAAGQLGELQAKVAADPKDYQARYDLALALYAAGEQEQALDELLEIVQRNRAWNEEAARKQLVKFFEALGPTHPLTLSARRRLSSLLSRWAGGRPGHGNALSLRPAPRRAADDAAHLPAARRPAAAGGAATPQCLRAALSRHDPGGAGGPAPRRHGAAARPRGAGPAAR